ncbi:hypothetical protein BJ742DRAFT_445142 [Cladochytrium replicatum]|nr:hypothetical protein BJ742DRAFT_445142 [Cladochytrium replicatum]
MATAALSPFVQSRNQTPRSVASASRSGYSFDSPHDPAFPSLPFDHLDNPLHLLCDAADSCLPLSPSTSGDLFYPLSFTSQSPPPSLSTTVTTGSKMCHPHSSGSSVERKRSLDDLEDNEPRTDSPQSINPSSPVKSEATTTPAVPTAFPSLGTSAWTMGFCTPASIKVEPNVGLQHGNMYCEHTFGRAHPNESRKKQRTESLRLDRTLFDHGAYFPYPTTMSPAASVTHWPVDLEPAPLPLSPEVVPFGSLSLNSPHSTLSPSTSPIFIPHVVPFGQHPAVASQHHGVFHFSNMIPSPYLSGASPQGSLPPHTRPQFVALNPYTYVGSAAAPLFPGNESGTLSHPPFHTPPSPINPRPYCFTPAALSPSTLPSPPGLSGSKVTKRSTSARTTSASAIIPSRSPSPEPFVCPTCHKTFRRHPTLAAHIRAAHPPPSSVSTTMAIPTITPRAVPFTASESRERSFGCPTCDKTFLRRHDLKRHLLLHSVPGGAKPFSCDRCSVSFTRQDALHRHLRAERCKK